MYFVKSGHLECPDSQAKILLLWCLSLPAISNPQVHAPQRRGSETSFAAEGSKAKGPVESSFPSTEPSTRTGGRRG